MNIRFCRHGPRAGILLPTAAAALTLLAGPLHAARAQGSTEDGAARLVFQIFDIPGADPPWMTSSMNATAQVVGSYRDPGGFHGFLYSAGTLTVLDAPGAVETQAFDINDRGEITGHYGGASGFHGFVYKAGTFTTFDVPGAESTEPRSINNRGEVAGLFREGGLQHGFIYRAGTFTTVDFPGVPGGTEITAINDSGQATGTYHPGSSYPIQAGFLYAGGIFTNFDLLGYIWITPSEINAKGQVTGVADRCLDPRCHSADGFIYRDGVYTILKAPGAPETRPQGINCSGQVTGSYNRGERLDPYYHGFVYTAGTFSTFDAPGSNTSPVSINDAGQVAGSYFDSSGHHGFIATPAATVLDDFSRQNGRLGVNWNGRASPRAYRVVDQQVSVGTGGPIYWQPNPFGLDQEAFVTLTRIDPAGAEQGLLLKVQGDTGNYRKGAIAVKYDAARQVIRVATWRPRSAAWRNYRNLPAAFADGDKLRARVLADGRIRIFHNGKTVGRVKLAAADRRFFNDKTGRIGLWYENAPGAALDNFGGGTRVQ